MEEFENLFRALLFPHQQQQQQQQQPTQQQQQQQLLLLQQLQLNLLLHAQGNQNTPENSQALSNSSIENKETLKDVVIPPSRYRKLFCDALGENNDVTRVDNSDDGDNDNNDEDDDEDEDEEEEEEELDWVGEVKGGTEDELPENERFCKKCKKNLTPETSVRCQKCHWATYCGEECKDKNESRHSVDCEKYIIFRQLENTIRNEQKTQETNLGRSFGHLKDVPGLEHEFFGCSKISVVIKLGPRLSTNVFLSEDLHGQRTNIKFEAMDTNLIEKIIADHDDLFIVIYGASFENLITSGTRKDIGIVDKRINVFFYKTSIQNGRRVFERFDLFSKVLELEAFRLE